jgi:TldD protein
MSPIATLRLGWCSTKRAHGAVVRAVYGEPVQEGTKVAATREVDAEFRALPLRTLADVALSTAKKLGAEHADFRLERVCTQYLAVRDGAVQTSSDSVSVGYAVRVIVDGTWGFAAGYLLDPDAVRAVADQAVTVARALTSVAGERVERAAEAVHADATWVSAYEIDPFDVPTAEKVALLVDRSDRLTATREVAHALLSVHQVKENKFYADLAGTVTTQQRVRVHPEGEATAVDSDSGAFETMSSLAPPVGRGWEFVSTGWDFDAELAELPGQLAEKMTAPSVVPGSYDLVIDPTNLWLTIHESIGHATEYDRAIGYEAAYAGSSFATPDKLGSLRYGSTAMNVTADRVEPHALATIGFDDDGVAAQRWDIVSRGRFVGYQLDRVFARRLGVARSNGCAYADSPGHTPIQRMANVSVAPDPAGGSTADLISEVEDGIYIVGDKSWSIDMQRYNFQFTGQRFYRIRNGELAGQLQDVAYQSTTTDFWNSLARVAGPETWRLGGAMNCGKGQPGQIAPVSHGCPSALFRGISVLNTRAEAGRGTA